MNKSIKLTPTLHQSIHLKSWIDLNQVECPNMKLFEFHTVKKKKKCDQDSEHKNVKLRATL